jgi:hypothetical protein
MVKKIIDLINKLKPTPNFISIWNLHDRLKGLLNMKMENRFIHI